MASAVRYPYRAVPNADVRMCHTSDLDIPGRGFWGGNRDSFPSHRFVHAIFAWIFFKVGTAPVQPYAVFFLINDDFGALEMFTSGPLPASLCG